ncbi:hydantoin utilization protein B [Acrocarpospora pleiomorpha]|uniref:Hydantoin utilization protein B n=1 Tax=Acrocarpospora pleiomorpha TaxID=90975 RepID=A0A5M3X8D1_9ACTN|nr:hydantoinase B/oxoprolinase family protein [Acrocarpospora pleiomorpha]GES17350.1 hydantoin utilization protein B [Acrocarpospora pleiomorpha]
MRGLSDRALLDVFGNRLQAIAEEMAYIIQRTGFTVYVKDALDFSASLVNPAGETIAYSQRLGVSITPKSMKEALQAAGPYQPGDIAITNDPASSGGLSTHLPDIYLWKPVFDGEDIVCFLACFIHSTDVGGSVFGSISPANTEIYQEGLRIPPKKLYRAGEINHDILDLFMANCRIPEQNWGDIKAILAAMNTAEERLHGMVDRFGGAAITSAMNDLVDYAEDSARAAILAIPDGEYHCVDYLDNDMHSDRPVRIELTLRVRGAECEFDFTGTDAQVRSAMNVPLYGQMHYFIAMSFFMYLHTINPTCPLNSGVLRPLRAVIEEGSILHPGPSAAVGVRAATVFRVQDVLRATLALAVPSVVPAASSGQVTIPLVSVPALKKNGMLLSTVSPIVGGSGARPDRDGIDGRGLSLSQGKNVPAERFEMDVPVVMRSFGLVADSCAPGRFRGGAAIHVEVEATAPGTALTARGMERLRFQPWGIDGGHAGSTGRTTVTRVDGTVEPIGKIDVLRLAPGERVRFESASGGAHGNPLDRAVNSIADDAKRGLISVEHAREAYGVVIEDGQVNMDATTAVRIVMADSDRPGGLDFGSARAEYDTAWPDAARAEFNAVVKALPAAVQMHIRELLHERASHRITSGESVSPELIQAEWREIKKLFRMA